VTLGSAPTAGSNGFLGSAYLNNNSSFGSIGMGSGTPASPGSVSLNAGVYLLILQVQFGNGGGGSLISYKVYINYGTGNTFSTTNSPTTTVGCVTMDYSSGSTFLQTVSLPVIVTPTTTTTYSFWVNFAFGGNGQIQGSNFNYSYVRLA
jgi:hypothetical protein